MNIIISIPWFSPAYRAGGPIKSIANLTETLTEDINYKILCSDKDLGGENLDVPKNCWVKYNINTEVCYISGKKTPVSIINEEIKRETVTVLFINGIYSYRFTIAPLLFSKISRKIVSVRGMLHPGALTQKPLKKKLYLFLWKAMHIYRKCSFHASTEQEKIYIEKIFGTKTKIFVAQNFPKIFFKQPYPEKRQGYLKLISIALISPMKNHLLVIKALMKCRGKITYTIYGAIKDVDYWNSCINEMKNLPDNIEVIYKGGVSPSEVEVVLAQNHVFILPSKSENFGHALVEALSAGRPIITSNNTPWNGLRGSKAGINVSTHDDSLTKAINYFAEMEEDEYSKWSTAANLYALKAINVEAIRNEYKEMFVS